LQVNIMQLEAKNSDLASKNREQVSDSILPCLVLAVLPHEISVCLV
jgi:hypothetical protein